MDKEDNYSENFTGLDYSMDQHCQNLLMKPQMGEASGKNSNKIIDYMVNSPRQHHQQQVPPGVFCASTSLDKLSFTEVMQFADFGPKLALNETKLHEEDTGLDPVCFLKFLVLNEKMEEQSLVAPHLGHGESEERFRGVLIGDQEMSNRGDEQEARVSDTSSAQLRFLAEQVVENNKREVKNKKKRPRTFKTSEEVESQRMTHIAVERNRRKQMNEHLRLLRSLMPGSYVQRGDQASIIGGAIEFVRELEQLLQCLESQKRRRLFGEPSGQIGDQSLAMDQPLPPFFPYITLPNDQMNLVDFEPGLQEETAENKSRLADVEVKLLGFDAMIKILSRRRPGQLIKTIAALEEFQLSILHTNITTIEQTVLYSFNVKITSESRCTAEDIASLVQQIFTFINANSSM